MKLITDCFGQMVRLTDERRAHILDHMEMQAMEPAIERVLLEPSLVRRSRSDDNVRLFYNFYAQTPVGGNGCVLWLNISRMTPLW
jgi:hypothetical protein